MRLLTLLVAFIVAFFALPEIAQAQAYPSRPITMIVPFPAGGPADTLARIVSERMRVSLGQPVIIETVTGAGASIGVGRAIASAPDGYTLSIGNWTSHVGGNAIYPVSWNVITDLEPIALLSHAPLIIVGKNGLPANDGKELIAWLKANPGKASVATVGNGSAAAIALLYLQQKTGTTFPFVPYRGSAPVMLDLVAGQIDLFCAEASQTLSFLRAGKIKAFAMLSRTRWVAAPDVPTMAEIGVPDLDISFWHGMWVPKGTPKDIIAKLNAAVVETLADPAVRKRLSELGQQIPPPEEQTPQALAAFHKSEVDKWWPIIKAANIKAE